METSGDGDEALSETLGELKEELQRESARLRGQVSRYQRLLNDCQAIAAENEWRTSRQRDESPLRSGRSKGRAACDVELNRLDLDSTSRQAAPPTLWVPASPPLSPVGGRQQVVNGSISPYQGPVLLSPRMQAPTTTAWPIYPDSPPVFARPLRLAACPQAPFSPVPSPAAAWVKQRTSSVSPVRSHAVLSPGVPKVYASPCLSPAATMVQAMSPSIAPALMRPVQVLSPRRTAQDSAAERLAQTLRLQATKQLVKALKGSVLRRKAAGMARWLRVAEEAALAASATAAVLSQLATYDRLGNRPGRVGSILATAMATESSRAAHHSRLLSLLLGVRQLHTLTLRRSFQDFTAAAAQRFDAAVKIHEAYSVPVSARSQVSALPAAPHACNILLPATSWKVRGAAPESSDVGVSTVSSLRSVLAPPEEPQLPAGLPAVSWSALAMKNGLSPVPPDGAVVLRNGREPFIPMSATKTAWEEALSELPEPAEAPDEDMESNSTLRLTNGFHQNGLEAHPRRTAYQVLGVGTDPGRRTVDKVLSVASNRSDRE